MPTRFWKIATVALVLLSASAPRRAAAQTACKDGTSSPTSGRGACSGHGGVAPKAAVPSKKADRAARSGPVTYKPSAQNSVPCADGTMSAGGRGACSRHGGVAATAVAPAPAPVTPAPSVRPQAAPRQVPQAAPRQVPQSAPRQVPQSAPRQAPQAAPRQAPTASTTQAPAGATAQCRDGTYSFSAHRSGTCSRHGGVATWM